SAALGELFGGDAADARVGTGDDDETAFEIALGGLHARKGTETTQPLKAVVGRERRARYPTRPPCVVSHSLSGASRGFSPRRASSRRARATRPTTMRRSSRPSRTTRTTST